MGTPETGFGKLPKILVNFQKFKIVHLFLEIYQIHEISYFGIASIWFLVARVCPKCGGMARAPPKYGDGAQGIDFSSDERYVCVNHGARSDARACQNRKQQIRH